ncbi:MAG TPA: ABC transporter substrate-binding protein [Acidimicrobiales bacterium]|nr:ABC transporter substrate-binding protein [Acidimicrobiales bacterium]
MSEVQRVRRRTGFARLVALLAALALVAVACGGDDGGNGGTAGGDDDRTTTTEDLGEPVRGGSIVVGLEAETNSWLPGEYAGANSGQTVALTFYDPLIQRDEDGVLRPYLAESIEENDDLTEWTLRLRGGIKFHDGTDLNAQVLKTIFDEYLKAEGATTAGTLATVTEMRVDDDLTVTYLLSEPNAAFPDILQGTIGWPFSVEAARAAGADAGSRPVGTGPFKFERWTRDDQLVVVRNEDYWREGLPYLDRITFRPIPDEDTRVQSLFSGDLDAMQSLRGSAIKQVMERDGYTAHLSTENLTGASIFNTLVPPLDDVRIRRAFAMSLQADDVAAVLGDDGLVDETTQWFSTDSPWWSQRVADAYPSYDPDGATQLVEEYKNDPERSDGKAVGEPVTFEYQCPPDPSLIEIAQLVQGAGATIGLEINLAQVEQAAHIQDGINGEYEVNCWRVGSQDDPATTLGNAFDDPETQILNFTNFTHPEIDRLVDELKRTADFDERYELVEQIGLIINEHVPVSFGVGTPTMVGVRNAVKNVPGWTFPDGTRGNGHPSAIARFVEVWLEE